MSFLRVRNIIAACAVVAIGGAVATAAYLSSVSGVVESDAAVTRSANEQPKVVSPFAPQQAVGSELDAALAGTRLVGLRVAEDASQSGAVFVTDGRERAIGVGGDVVRGVRLAAVTADGVVLEYAGDHRTIVLERATSPLAASVESGRRAPADATQAVGAGDWLRTILATPEEAVGAPMGWRVVGPLPEAAVQAGLRPGDLILSVNGIEPRQGVAALRAASANYVMLAVVRSSGERETVWFHRDVRD